MEKGEGGVTEIEQINNKNRTRVLHLLPIDRIRSYFASNSNCQYSPKPQKRPNPRCNKKASINIHSIERRRETIHTWVGRMAVSRAERRWSKEPKIETMLSVMDWLFTRASLICAALSLSISTPTTTPPPLLLDGIPIPFLLRLRYRQREKRKHVEKSQKKRWSFFGLRKSIFQKLHWKPHING